MVFHLVKSGVRQYWADSHCTRGMAASHPTKEEQTKTCNSRFTKFLFPCLPPAASLLPNGHPSPAGQMETEHPGLGSGPASLGGMEDCLCVPPGTTTCRDGRICPSRHNNTEGCVILSLCPYCHNNIEACKTLFSFLWAKEHGGMDDCFFSSPRTTK